MRWLPRGAEVELRGVRCGEVERVVARNGRLARTLDEVSFEGRRKAWPVQASEAADADAAAEVKG